MENELIDNVWKMVEKWNKENFGYNQPEIVLICSPNYYGHLRSDYEDRIHYIRSDYQYKIEFLEIIGLKVPVIIGDNLPKNIEYQLMFKKDYERQEKEKLYMKLNAMFD